MSKLKVTVRVDFHRADAIGPGKVALLEKLRDCGSLSQAARELKMSYRRAWQLLDSLNRSFSEPLARTVIGGSRGGGSTLTVLGEAVVASYRSLEAETNALAVRHLRPILKAVVASGQAVRRPISRSRPGMTVSRARSRAARA